MKGQYYVRAFCSNFCPSKWTHPERATRDRSVWSLENGAEAANQTDCRVCYHLPLHRAFPDAPAVKRSGRGLVVALMTTMPMTMVEAILNPPLFSRPLLGERSWHD